MQRELQNLSDEHWQQLTTESAIAPDVIAERGYRTLFDKSTIGKVEDRFKDSQRRAPALAFPTYRLGTSEPYAWVLRPDRPRTSQHNGREKPIKYEWPASVTACLDVLPSYRAELGNPDVPLWITEGAKKADALASAFNTAIVPVNINGVWGWRGKNEHGGKLALPDLEHIAWNGRTVGLMFDSDVMRNRMVHQALKRLAHVLTSRGAAKVLALVLPQDGENKLGVDDALAQGWDASQIMSHLIPFSEALSLGRDKLFLHPETQKPLYLPAGYVNSGESIARVDRDEPSIIYPGLIAVTASGVDLGSKAETLTVRFTGRGDRAVEVIAPRAELSRSKGVIEHLASRGAAAHEGNARELARYLSEFAHENRDALPHREHTDKLGLIDGGLVLPTESVGFDRDVRYVGKHTIRVGTDHEAYKRAIAEALTWQNVEAFWAVLSLSLASPAIARTRPRRNPTAYLSGSSNSGKTTTAQFASGAWGDPTRAPLRIEAGRTTRAGMMQTLEELNGLTLFIDEAHTARDPRDLEATVYQFANGEAYTRGGADGKTRGGETLGGVVILAGEALPEFRHAGSHGRVLWIDVGQHPPLGCEPKSLEGAQRAELLEQAWLSGAGWLGRAVANAMWRDWPAFIAKVQQVQAYSAIKALQPWRDPLAIAFTTLDLMFDVVDLQPPEFKPHLLEQWANILTDGREKSDPAADAWEQLLTMLAQADRWTDKGWDILKLNNQMIACRPINDAVWRVPVQTQQFKDRVGASTPQLHGKTWIQRAWIMPHAKGETTSPNRVAGGMLTRALLIPHAQLFDEDE